MNNSLCCVECLLKKCNFSLEKREGVERSVNLLCVILLLPRVVIFLLWSNLTYSSRVLPWNGKLGSVDLLIGPIEFRCLDRLKRLNSSKAMKFSYMNFFFTYIIQRWMNRRYVSLVIISLYSWTECEWVASLSVLHGCSQVTLLNGMADLQGLISLGTIYRNEGEKP